MSEAVQGYLIFKSTRASVTTIQTDTVLLGQFMDWLPGDPDTGDVDAGTIRAYLEHQAGRGLSPHTIRRHHAILSALFAWLASDHIALVDSNPARLVQPPKLPKQKIRYLSRDEVRALLNATDRARLKRRARALMLFMLDTGARASEVAGVQLPDVDLKSGKVLVTGKGDKQRFVYLGRRALSAVWLYVADERPDPARVKDKHLFLTMDGYPMDRHSIRLVIRRLAKWAGVRAYPHLLRHTAAVERLRAGMNVFDLQRMMGHETLEMTRKYLSALSDEDTEAAAKRTSPADNWRL